MEDPNVQYVSYREKRQNGKNGRTLKYFLQDEDGEETLCAVGEETTQGDAHYYYRNAKSFGTKYGVLACHNRRELHLWLDTIIAGSARNHGGESNMGAGGGVEKKKIWTSHRQEKFHFDDGRRGTRFYLVDDAGVEVAAVLGEERDTRDGHYMYRKEESFGGGHPLCCGNLTGVHRWLREMMSSSPFTAPLASSSGRPPKRASTMEGRMGHRYDTGGHDYMHDEDDETFAMDTGHTAERASKRFRGSGEEEAWDVAASALAEEERCALEVAVSSASERRAALAWLREPPLEDICEAVRVRKSIVDECWAAGAGANSQVINETLAALRELELYHMSLALLEATQVSRSVAALRSHPFPPLASLAGSLCDQWQGMLYRHMGILTLDLDEAAGLKVDGHPPTRPVLSRAHAAQLHTAASFSEDSPSAAAAAAAAVASAAAPRIQGIASPKTRRGILIPGGAGSGEGPARERRGPGRPPGSGGGRERSSPRRVPGARPGHHSALAGGSPSTPTPRRRGSIDSHPPSSPPSPGGVRHRGSSSGAMSPGRGMPLGKGRKLCTECDQVVGSPTRVCPHCQATLPLKIGPKSPHTGPKSPGGQARGSPRGGAGGGGLKPRQIPALHLGAPRHGHMPMPPSPLSKSSNWSRSTSAGGHRAGGRGDGAGAAPYPAAAARGAGRRRSSDASGTVGTLRGPGGRGGAEGRRSPGESRSSEGTRASAEEAGSDGAGPDGGSVRGPGMGMSGLDDDDDDDTYDDDGAYADVAGMDMDDAGPAAHQHLRSGGGDSRGTSDDDDDDEEEEDDDEDEEDGGEHEGVFRVEDEGRAGEGEDDEELMMPQGGSLGEGGGLEALGPAPEDDEELARWLAPAMQGSAGVELADFMEGQRGRLASCPHAELRTVVKSYVQGACDRLRALAPTPPSEEGGSGGRGGGGAALRHVESRCRALLRRLPEVTSAQSSAERARVRRDIIQDFDALLDVVSPEDAP